MLFACRRSLPCSLSLAIVVLSAQSGAMPSAPLPNPGRAVAPSGAFVTEIPIPTAPGTAGFSPDLRLRYSSQAGDGHFGFGWALNLSEIRRTKRFGMPAGTDAPTEQFELDGRLIQQSAVQGSFRRYKSAIPSLDRILSSPSSGAIDSWEVTSPDGVRSRYGTTTDSKVKKNGTGLTLRWLLSERIDANENTIKFTYDTTDTGNPGISKVQYSYRGGVVVGGTVKEVIFDYTSRGDSADTFDSGHRVTLSRRVYQIRLLVGGATERKLVLGYTGYASGVYSTERARLTSVQHCAPDCGAPVEALPETQYLYSDGEDVPEYWVEPGTSTFNLTFPIEELTTADQSRDLGWRVGDVDGDGLPDLVRAYRDTVNNTHTSFHDVWLNTGSGFVRDGEWSDALASTIHFNNPIVVVDKNVEGNITNVVPSDNDSKIFFAEKRDWRDGWAGSNDLFLAPVNARLVDVNGDRRADIVASFLTAGGEINCPGCIVKPPVKVAEVWINTGDTWVRDALRSAPFSESTGAGLPPFESLYVYENIGQEGVDFPGDSKCVAHYQGGGCSAKIGWFPSGAHLADVNGDSAVDILATHCNCIPDGAQLPQGTWLGGTGNLYVYQRVAAVPADPFYPPVTQISTFFADGNYVDTGVRYVDLNGDGLSDLVKTPTVNSIVHQSDFNAGGVWLSTGEGWCSGPSEGCEDTGRYEIPHPFLSLSLIPQASGLVSNQLVFADVNRDGLVDLLRADARDSAGGLQAWLQDRSDPGAQNTVWRVDNRYKPKGALALSGNAQQNYAESARSRGVLVSDFDGNGNIDFIRSYDSGSGVAKGVRLSEDLFADRLIDVDNGEGGKVAVTYTSLVTQRLASTLGLQDLIDAKTWTTSDEESSPLSIREEFWPTLPVVQESTVTTTKPSQSYTYRFEFGGYGWDQLRKHVHGPRLFYVERPDGSSVWTYLRQRRGLEGQIGAVEIGSQSGAVRTVDREVVRDWDLVPASVSSPFNPDVGRLAAETTRSFVGGVAGTESKIVYGYLNQSDCAFNLPCSIQVSRPSGNSTIIRRYRPVAENDTTGPWLIRLPTSERVENGTGLERSDVTFTYSGAGNRTGVTAEVSPPILLPNNTSVSQVGESWGYDPWSGTLVTHIDPLLKQTWFVWDATKSVLTEITDPASGILSIPSRDPVTGGIKELHEKHFWGHLDKTTFHRDPFGRVDEILFDPAGSGPEETLEIRVYQDGEPAGPAQPFVETTRYTGPGGTIRTAQYFDGLGRRAREVGPGDSNSTVGVGRRFDFAGRVLAQSLPWHCASDLHCTGLNVDSASTPKETFEYDGLGRLTKRERPDGDDTVTYGSVTRSVPTGVAGNGKPWETRTIVDAMNHATRYLVDNDRVGWVDECKGTGAACTTYDSTAYVYEPSGNVKRIYDPVATSSGAWTASAHFIEIAYDTLGRQRSVQDPNAGTNSFEYDEAGNVRIATNARGDETEYEYDDLYRVTDILYPDLSAAEIDYDPVTRDRLAVQQGDPATSSGYRLEYGYDDLGRLSREYLKTNGVELVANYQRDLVGRPTRIEYPGRQRRGSVHVSGGAPIPRLRCATSDGSNHLLRRHTRLRTDRDL